MKTNLLMVMTISALFGSVAVAQQNNETSVVEEAVSEVTETVTEVTEQATDAVSDMVSADTIAIEEGKDYTVLQTPISTSSGDLVEVKEFFWYGCPHCFALEDDIIGWKANMPSSANYVATPVPLKGQWELHARVYYTLAALNKVEELHQEVFDYLHVERKPITNEEQAVEFLAANGIDAELAEQTLNSFAVNNQIAHAYNEFRNAQLKGVPNIIVNGKYVTNPQLAGSEERTMDVVNALVQKSLTE